MNQITLTQHLLKTGPCITYPDPDKVYMELKPIKIKRGTQLFDLKKFDIRETDGEIIIE